MKFKHIYSGIKAVIKYEGIFSMLSRGFSFFITKLVVFDFYYSVCLDLKLYANEKEADFLPKTDNFTWKMITSNHEADELEKNGYNFGAYEINLRASLDRDAIVLCIFINNELAHRVCLADNQRGQKTIDYRPFSVDFKNNEIATGRALTIPKYRRLYLRIYSGYLVRQYCLKNDIKIIKGTVGEYNATMIAAAKHGHLTILSKCLLIKILFFRFHKEWEMSPITPEQILQQKQGYREKIIKKINR